MERLTELEPVYMDTLPDVKDLEYGKMYISRKYGVSEHLCPDGCGETVATLFFNPDCPECPREGGRPEWKFVFTEDGKVMVHPSVLNRNCPNRAHYYITYNRIQWL